jgi:membrane protein implicated in regulation of membrane protease activity
MPFWMWLAVSGVLLVVEILTVDLLFASLAFSALLAAGASALGFNLVVQGIVFKQIWDLGLKLHAIRTKMAKACKH